MRFRPSFILLGVPFAAALATPAVEPALSEASRPVRVVLDRAESAMRSGAFDDALRDSERATETALAAHDAPGEARSRVAQAGALDALGRFEEAIAAWSEARSTWGRVGAGPEQIRASLEASRLEARADASTLDAALNEAIASARAEKRRPIAAASALAAAAESFRRSGLLVECAKLSGVAVEIHENRAPGSLELAMSLNGRGYVAWAQGDSKAAEADFARALKIREERAPGSLDIARSLIGLGLVARSRSEWDPANAKFNEALAIQQAMAPDSLEVAGSLTNLGVVAYARGDLDTAWDRHQRALAIREAKAPGSLELAQSLANVASVAFLRGDLTGARASYERALHIQEVRAPGLLDMASTLNSLGLVAHDEGDLAAARAYYERGLKIREAKAPGSPRVASSLKSLGAVATDQGDLRAARELYERALAIQEAKAQDSLEVAAILNDLGRVARSQGDLAAAQLLHERALVIQEAKAPGSLEMAWSLNNLGVVAGMRGDLPASRSFHERALAIKEAKAPGSIDVATTLNNLGIVARLQGDYAASRSYQERALELKEAKAPGSLLVASSLNNLGTVSVSQGDVAAAKSYYERALAIRQEKAPGSLDLAASYRNLGTVALEEGDIAGARQRFADAWSIVRGELELVTGDEARQGFTRQNADYAYDLLRADVALGDDAAAFAALEESRSQGLLQMLAFRGIEGELDDPAMWPAYLAADAEYQRAAKRLEQAPDGTAREAARQELVSRRLDKEARLASIRNAVPALHDRAVSLEEARPALPRDALWVAFAVGEESSVLFLIPAKPGPIRSYVIEIKESELRSKVTALLHQIAAVPPDAEDFRRELDLQVVEQSRELYRLLFPEPARPLVQGVGRLMISPDGILWELPFAALVTSPKGKVAWLGLEKPLSLHQSLSAFAREGELRRQAARGVLIVGNPAFGGKEAPEADSARSFFQIDGKPPGALPGTGREAKALSELYATPALIGAAATEPDVRRRLTGVSIAHFATHGYFHPTLPMSSGILLAAPVGEHDAAATRDDGVLQAYEFSGDLKLKADLVVLSACETGRGEKVAGEGLVGLTRALHMAGARSVVATHWRIGDQSSADLMVAFHRRLEGGMAKDEALRRAMAETGKKRASREPYYWSAFFLSGGVAPLHSAD